MRRNMFFIMLVAIMAITATGCASKDKDISGDAVPALSSGVDQVATSAPLPVTVSSSILTSLPTIASSPNHTPLPTPEFVPADTPVPISESVPAHTIILSPSPAPIPVPTPTIAPAPSPTPDATTPEGMRAIEGNRDYKVAYLTFDDSPSENTGMILDVLDKYKIKATFFAIGSNALSYKDTLKEIAKKGHSIGNHSFSHDKGIYESLDSFKSDFDKMQQSIFESTGLMPSLFRFPWSSGHKCCPDELNRDIITYISDKGCQYFDWDVYAGDISSGLTKDDLLDGITKGIGNRKRAVILMHDEDGIAESLPSVIEMLMNKDYFIFPLNKNSYAPHFFK